MGKNGKYYEKKTAELLQKFRPNEKVQHNVKILGKLSKKNRQIDVLVEPSDFDLLIFECKDHGRPIDLDVFGVFTSLLEDINIDRAAMVSNSPYTDGVQNLAGAKNIDLLHIIDTSDPKMRTQLRASVLLIDSKLKSFQMGFQTTTSFSEAFPYDPIIQGPDFVGHGRDYLKHLWNETDKLSEETGGFEYVIQNASILSVNGNTIPMDKITFVYNVDKEHYLGDLEIINTQGIFNVKEGSYQTRSLETAPLVAYEAEKIWKKIPEEEARNVRVSVGVGCKSILR